MKIIEMIDGNRNINFYKLRTGVVDILGLTDLSGSPILRYPSRVGRTKENDLVPLASHGHVVKGKEAIKRGQVVPLEVFHRTAANTCPASQTGKGHEGGGEVAELIYRGYKQTLYRSL
jgi:hypothetical protein